MFFVKYNTNEKVGRENQAVTNGFGESGPSHYIRRKTKRDFRFVSSTWSVLNVEVTPT
jgi:hypothetical protein